ncbi:PAS domain-containing sensor histidine kinase [uncultured Alsobacter sp.]|uniref:PAS domain-containing sensor histidine kinase n=1 Tax=uncultured Alsobacter sp. TaxID=1748258 RepID=UPI0025D0403E|nr:PAS domain-containing sensor histidine kinase [uncultured Alsobacter sp.]
MATGLRWQLGAYAALVVPFALYFPVVTWAAFTGGTLPALATTAAATGLAVWLFMPPGQPPADMALNAALFVASCGVLSVLAVGLRRSRADLRELEDLYGVVQHVALDGIVIYEAIRDGAGKVVDLRRIAMNAAAERVLGPARQLVGQSYLDSSPTVSREALFTRYVTVLETGIPAADEFMLEAGRRWFYNFATRAGGDRIAVTFRDITDTRATIEKQKFLMRELNHRVKNVLTSALSLARQTATSGTAAQYRDALTARITAMARAHDLLMTESWEGALLSDVVTQTLAPYDRVFVEGPSVAIAADLALALNMALHELATNAVKYGALSTADGHVSIRWRLADPAARRVHLAWVEEGGPTVSQPTHSGFGSRLLGRGFATANRSIDIAWHATGLVCEMTFLASDDEGDGDQAHPPGTF